MWVRCSRRAQVPDLTQSCRVVSTTCVPHSSRVPECTHLHAAPPLIITPARAPPISPPHAGDKCKFSHDLTITRKAAKRDVYSDTRPAGGDGDKKADGIEDWDQAKLEAVVKTKHGAERRETKTDIVCMYFLDALERELYGWFWECPVSAHGFGGRAVMGAVGYWARGRCGSMLRRHPCGAWPCRLCTAQPC